MGLEITGFTRPNLDKLWIDPFDYQRELQTTVEALVTRGMNISIYNHPLYLLPRPLWKFAKRSISDWKTSSSMSVKNALYAKNAAGSSSLRHCGAAPISNLYRRDGQRPPSSGAHCSSSPLLPQDHQGSDQIGVKMYFYFPREDGSWRRSPDSWHLCGSYSRFLGYSRL
jgi:hypothetical protein